MMQADEIRRELAEMTRESAQLKAERHDEERRQDEADRDLFRASHRREVALEMAARLYAGDRSRSGPSSVKVLDLAETFERWLEKAAVG